MTNQKQENERTKEAYQKENEFLKKEVIGKGADSTEPDRENIKTDIEKSIEDWFTLGRL